MNLSRKVKLISNKIMIFDIWNGSNTDSNASQKNQRYLTSKLPPSKTQATVRFHLCAILKDHYQLNSKTWAIERFHHCVIVRSLRINFKDTGNCKISPLCNTERSLWINSLRSLRSKTFRSQSLLIWKISKLGKERFVLCNIM